MPVIAICGCVNEFFSVYCNSPFGNIFFTSLLINNYYFQIGLSKFGIPSARPKLSEIFI